MNDEIEIKAREEIVSIAKKHKLYFVVHYAHTGNFFVALKNKSHKAPEIYVVMYELYNDVVKDDIEIFRFKLNDKFMWTTALVMIKANLPYNRKQG